MRKLGVILAFLPLVALADSGDPPSRVARLSYLSGAVSFQAAGWNEWAGATLNRPLTTGDQLWTAGDARAEMNIDTAAVRLGQQTSFMFLNLDDRAAQVKLSQGSLEVRLRQLYDDQSFEIDTPNVAVSLLRPGVYRVDVSGDGNESVVTVRAGEGEVTGGGQAFSVRANQSARISGMDTPSYDTASVPPPDRFDDWCATRDRREEQSQSARYVSHDMVGYQDLDDYGQWRMVPPYGWVWMPGVEAGWAPYRFGHWVWVEPWGWTWVDDAPWGFAPFHYGRWVFATGYWAWVPGPVAVRPVYAPALVAWVGGVGVGWFPLGPGEVYMPARTFSRTYVTRVNVTNTVVNNVTINNSYTNVTSVRYVNRTAPGAVTVVSQRDFESGRPVARAVVRTPAAATAPVVSPTAIPARPQRLIPAVSNPAPRPPERAVDRRVVVRSAPPAATSGYVAAPRVMRTPAASGPGPHPAMAAPPPRPATTERRPEVVREQQQPQRSVERNREVRPPQEQRQMQQRPARESVPKAKEKESKKERNQ